MAKVSAPTMPEVDAYISNAAPFAQPILRHLREVVHEGAPGVEEAIKWSQPFFLYRGIILAHMAAFKQHCSFGMWGREIASTLRSDGVASGGAMASFDRITSLEDLPPRRQILSYVKLAAQAIDSGQRTSSIARPPASLRVVKPAPAVPEALIHALRGHPAAAENFAAMSPSCQREYSEWIAEAKRDETRHKRVATAIEWIAEGKSRNWKYERR